MDDRHKTPRIYASGAQKRKLKVDRDNQREEVISQIPKLTNYFISSRQQMFQKMKLIMKMLKF